MSGPSGGQSSNNGPRKITVSELAKHRSRNDGWLSIEGSVYDVTEFIEHHPGGIGQIMTGCGINCTDLFMQTHPSVNYKKILKKYYLGVLTEDPEYEPETDSSSLDGRSNSMLENSTQKVTTSENQEEYSQAPTTDDIEIEQKLLKKL